MNHQSPNPSSALLPVPTASSTPPAASIAPQAAAAVVLRFPIPPRPTATSTHARSIDSAKLKT